MAFQETEERSYFVPRLFSSHVLTLPKYKHFIGLFSKFQDYFSAFSISLGYSAIFSGWDYISICMKKQYPRTSCTFQAITCIFGPFKSFTKRHSVEADKLQKGSSSTALGFMVSEAMLEFSPYLLWQGTFAQCINQTTL